MNGTRKVPPVTELVYVAPASWSPILVAIGLAAVVAGLFNGWVWSVLGAVVVLLAAVRWLRAVQDDIGRMPRSQRPTAAVLPPIPPRPRR